MKDSNALNIPALIPRPKNITLTGKTAPADAAVTEQTARILRGGLPPPCHAGEYPHCGRIPGGIRPGESTLEQLRFSYRDRIPCMEISDAPEKPLPFLSHRLCQTFYPRGGAEENNLHGIPLQAQQIPLAFLR